MIRSATLVIFLLASTVYAKTEIDCSVRSLTNSCTEFSEPQGVDPWAQTEPTQEIEPVVSGYFDSSSETYAELQQKMNDAYFFVQADLLSSLKSGSNLFKLAVSSPANLGALMSFFELGEGQPYAFNQFRLPWPSTSDLQSDVRDVDFESFRKDYFEKLSADEKALLKSAATKIADTTKEIQASYPPANYGGSVGTSYLQSDSSKSSKEKTSLLAPANQSLGKSQIEQMKAEQSKRFQSLVDQAKKFLIEEIQARPLQGNASDRDLLITKIQAIKFSGIEGPTHSTNCMQDQLNAFYIRNTNSITICSAYTQESDVAAIFAIGHEIGHAIDPCSSYDKIHTTHLEPDLFMQRLSEEDWKLSREQKQSLAREAISFDGHFYNLDTTLPESSISELEESGILEPKYTRVGKVYPFDTTYRCLSRHHGFATGKAKGTMQEAKRKRILKDTGISLSSPVDKLRKDCSDSEMTEVMSDVFGAKVLARFAGASKKTARSDLQSALSLFLKGNCQGSTSGFESNHIFDYERVEKTVTADPLIREVFGCKEVQGNHSYCLNQFGSVKVQTSKPSSQSGDSKGQR